MKFTTLLNEDSKEAIDYFKGRNLEDGFAEIEKLRKKIIWEEEAIFNIRVAFEKLGIPFDIKTSIADTLIILDCIQVRLVQVRDYLYNKRGYHYFTGCSSKLCYPEWRM